MHVSNAGAYDFKRSVAKTNPNSDAQYVDIIMVGFMKMVNVLKIKQPKKYWKTKTLDVKIRSNEK